MGLFTENPLSVFMQQQKPKLNNDIIWLKIVGSDSVKNFIIDLNTEGQLFEQGIDSTGTSLKDINGGDLTASGYAPKTVFLKQQKGGKGGRIKNITLYDEGDYYASHEVDVTPGKFTIDSDPIKEDTNLFKEWGEDIVGLTDESLQKLINFLLPKYLEYTQNVVFN